MKKKVVMIVIAIQILMLCCLPFPDKQGSLWYAISYATFALLSVELGVLGIVELARRKERWLSTAIIPIYMFSALCIIGVINSLFRGGSIGDVIRGLIPYSWFAYIAFLTVFDWENKEIQRCLKLVALVGTVSGIRILIYYIIYVSGNPYERVTFHLTESVSILPMVSAIIWFYYFCISDGLKERILYSFLYGFEYMMVCYTNTKAMMLSVLLAFGLMCVLLLMIDRKKEMRLKVLLLLGIVSLVSIVVMRSTGFAGRWQTAINSVKQIALSQEKSEEVDEKVENSDVVENDNTDVVEDDNTDVESQEPVIIKEDQGSVNVRIEEIKVACQRFRESPIIGNGIGYRWSSSDLDYANGILYMHNIIAYVAMDFGILGILFLLYILIIMIKRLIAYLKSDAAYDKKVLYIALFSTIAMSFCYANLFAIYRTVDFVFICGLIWSIMYSIRTDK